MRARPPAPSGPAFDDARLSAAREQAVAVWTAESGRERDRLLGLPSAARLAALDDDAVRQLLTEEHRAEVRASFTAEPAKGGSGAVATTWEAERRRMAAVMTARPIAAAGCAVAALAPFALAAWRWGWGIGEALGVFLAPGPALAGSVAAAIVAGVLARLTSRSDTQEGLGWLVVAAFGAGVAGLALAAATI